MDSPPFISEFQVPLTGLEGQYGPYIANPRLVHAANTALGLQMPLLLTGDPGSGKSDFAWVVAKALGNAQPLRCQVRSTTTARDLLYHYDALVRFSDAQSSQPRAADPRNYIRLRPLGVALMSASSRPPVVLLDEIDKAPRDLPNDLLWELDEGHFEIAEIADVDDDSDVRDPNHLQVPLRRVMRRPQGATRPLVVITSNSERQLPEAFLRRCVFFHIPTATAEQLAEIARKRFPPGEGERGLHRLLGRAIEVFEALRQERLTKKPTTAEMLDWVSALTSLHERGRVEAIIEAFVGELEEGRLPPGAAVRWIDLPALGCLVKLREDFQQLELRGA